MHLIFVNTKNPLKHFPLLNFPLFIPYFNIIQLGLYLLQTGHIYTPFFNLKETKRFFGVFITKYTHTYNIVGYYYYYYDT